MKQIFVGASRGILAALVAVLILIPSVSVAKNLEEEPSAGAMVADALVARPLLLVATVIGTGVYVVTLPFSLLGGNSVEAGKTLVVGPAHNTFVRCLGCRKPGYQQ